MGVGMERLKRLAKWAPLGGLAGGLISFFSLYLATHHVYWFVFLAGFAGGVVATFVLGFQFIEITKR